MNQLARYCVTAMTCALVLSLSPMAAAYEINNHADMSQEAANLSVLRTTPDKLFRLGLKQVILSDPAQTFPLKQIDPFGPVLGPIPYCFGSVRRGNGGAWQWKVTIPYGDPLYPATQQDGDMQQPFPSGTTILPELSIAQMIRYGACYEDEEEPKPRSITHFYNPQSEGAGVTTAAGVVPLAANSLRWMLQRNAGPTFKSGVNHYTWPDTRDVFYKALTSNWPTLSAAERAAERKAYWGQTFQALGHMVHHLQDMGSPQHVRSDYHCNSQDCYKPPLGWLDKYRPSGYETYFEEQFRTVKALAQSATAPIVFGLPREFWNTNTDNNLDTTNPGGYMAADQGMAAYTATNFTSVGRDFRVSYDEAGTPEYLNNWYLSLPRPSGRFEDVNVTQLFSPESAPVLATLCGGSTTNCNMRFMGTSETPAARTSATSILARELLVPKDPNTGLPTYTGEGLFTQNFFTYTDAGVKLIPKAVEYSAGLINYFFRGDFAIRPPEEGIYGLLDGADPQSNCKDNCGFRKLRARVTNTTAPINGAPQDMTGGKVLAVVKFSRNSCYKTDWSGDLGELNDYDTGMVKPCYLAWADEPLEEIVTSAPIDVTQLAVGAEQSFTFDFSANPVPINAWNMRLQIVFRGTLGAEPDAVAVSTVWMSAPTVVRKVNEAEWIYANGQFHLTSEIENDQIAMAELPTGCRQGFAPNITLYWTHPTMDWYEFDGTQRSLSLYQYRRDPYFYYSWPTTYCYPEVVQEKATLWSTATNTALATTRWLPQGHHSALVVLGSGDDGAAVDLKITTTTNRPAFWTLDPLNLTVPLRRVEWDDSIRYVRSNSFWRYRGLHMSGTFSSYKIGGVTSGQPSTALIVDRPPPRTPVFTYDNPLADPVGGILWVDIPSTPGGPQKMTSIDSRY